MSYSRTNWQTGDTITAEKLNNIESGIEGNSVFLITVTLNESYMNVADKTYSEIQAAYQRGKTLVCVRDKMRYALAQVYPSYFVFTCCSQSKTIYEIKISSNNSVDAPYVVYYSKPQTGIPQTDLAVGVRNKLMRADHDRRQIIPIEYDGSGFTVNISAEQIESGYTLTYEQGGEQRSASFPAFQESSYTMGMVYMTNMQWVDGIRFMLSPDYSNVDGVTFHSPITKLDGIGMSGYVGVLTIEPLNGYIENYDAKLHYWKDEGV